MPRKLIGFTALAATVAAAAAGGAVVLGEGTPQRPAATTVTVKMQAAEQDRARAKPKRPQLFHVAGAPTPVDVDQVGTVVDLRLRGCPSGSKVVDGGVVASDPGVYQQGTYLEGRRIYHVLLAFMPGAEARDFNVNSHLICLGGVRS